MAWAGFIVLERCSQSMSGRTEEKKDGALDQDQVN